jgi:excisionase family DNA binding protein
MDKLMTTDEVTEVLGVTRSTLDNWRAAGVLSVVKLGSAVRFRRTDIERLSTEGTTWKNSKK